MIECRTPKQLMEMKMSGRSPRSRPDTKWID
jgi:hypothetical protein